MNKTVFNSLYDFLREEFDRQGVTSAMDLSLPVRTVWGWYMKAQGVQNGQKLDLSESGRGLLLLVSQAACMRRAVPKEDRLQMMAPDDVHPSFRARAEEWMGADVVYVCDVAYHPSDADRVAVCAVPASFMDPLLPSPQDDEQPAPIEVKEEEDGSVTFQIETLAGNRIDHVPAMTSERNEGIEPEPASKQVPLPVSEPASYVEKQEPEIYRPRPDYQEMPPVYQDAADVVAERQPSAASPVPEPEPAPRPSPAPAVDPAPAPRRSRKKKAAASSPLDRGLFDDLLMEFASHCHDTEYVRERSWWSGEMVETADLGTLWKVFIIGMCVIACAYYPVAIQYIDAHAGESLSFWGLISPMCILAAIWAAILLWIDRRMR